MKIPADIQSQAYDVVFSFPKLGTGDLAGVLFRRLENAGIEINEPRLIPEALEIALETF